MATRQSVSNSSPASQQPLAPPFSAKSDLTQCANQPIPPNPLSTPPNVGSAPPPQGPPAAPATDVLAALPTIFHDRNHHVVPVQDDLAKFLSQDLDVSRLNKIHGMLWGAGRPLNARPLHRQKMMDRRVVHTQQADLHLLYVDNRIFLKPLPAWLLSHDFWLAHLCAPAELHRNATGFLLSYIWLICSDLDFMMAAELNLLPAGVTWEWWKAFVADFLSRVDANALDQVNPRYHFGELRLGRINTFYRIRFCFTHFVRGYLYGYNRYGVYFQRNFGWIVVIFIYFSVVLSAMQVGIAVTPLNTNKAFQQVSYGFVVFSIVAVAAVVAFVSVVFVGIFMFNTVAAISHAGKEERDRARLARAKVGTGKA